MKSDDLISRSALKKDLLDRSFFPAIVKAALEKAPAVDPENLRAKGRWIDTGESYEDEHCRYNYWACSVCENRIAGRYGLHNYCPNCGAKMEG